MSMLIIETSKEALESFVNTAKAVLDNWEYLSTADPKRYYDITDADNGLDIRIDPAHGICYWVEDYLHHHDMCRVYGAWKHFSGKYTYPVEGYDAYIKECDGEVNLYANPLRHKLAQWVYDCAVKALEEYPHDD